MPTYQYACTACDHRLEAVQSFSDASLTECPVCGGALRKVFSAVGVVFKGSGFYKNDSRDSSNKAGTKADSGKSDSGKGDGNKGDSKTAAPAAASSSDSSGGSSSNGSGGSSSSSSGGSSSGDSSSAAAPKAAPAKAPVTKSA